MKTILTPEESRRLIDLGVDTKLASKRTLGVQIPTGIPNVYHKKEGGDPIFTLADLLSILPKEIKGYHLEMGTNDDEWYAEYDSVRLKDSYTFAPELIDALYQLLIWVIENGYVKPSKDN
ncbi:MAG: hypothetical protein HDR38_08175 [Treponema sp.]|nr:hypothetical protein [Bacteroides sp.]MBD5427504.1 hypothetical protein [Treponema sp.]